MDSKELRLFREAYSSIYEGYKEKEEKGEKEEKECVDKEDKGKHNCAKKVCHESFGEGTCIFGEHAVPDENGFVSHYDVMFEHGVERNVPVEDMEVLVLEEHPMEGHRYEGEKIAEAGGPALPGEPGRPGTPKAPGGRPHLPGEKQTPAPKKPGMTLQLAGADLFDIVKGYLMSEGYADTEEAALAIMTNMSEEWRQSIVEGLTSDQEARRRELSRQINKAGTPGNPGVNDPATRKMQGEYIQLQKLKGV